MAPTVQRGYVPSRCRGVERGKRGSSWRGIINACETGVWNANAGTFNTGERGWQGNKTTLEDTINLRSTSTASPINQSNRLVCRRPTQHKMQELNYLAPRRVCGLEAPNQRAPVARYPDIMTCMLVRDVGMRRFSLVSRCRFRENLRLVGRPEPAYGQ